MLRLDPRPVIIAEVVFSNVGGTATGMYANYMDNRENVKKRGGGGGGGGEGATMLQQQK